MVAGKKEHAMRIVVSQQFAGPVLLDAGSELRRRYGIDRVPYTLVLDQTGEAKAVALGGKDKSDLLKLIDRVQ